jgi:hypothetical protein
LLKANGYPKTVDIINDEYGLNTTVRALASYCSANGIYAGPHPPHHGEHLRIANSLPIGAERFDGNDWYIKVSDDQPKSTKKNGLARLNWRLKSHFVYEQHHGAMPENSTIIFIDGNRHNFDIDNLCCISRSKQGYLAQNKWLNKNKEITLLALGITHLVYAVKDVMK